MKNTNKNKCHSKLDLESSTRAVSQQQQPAWKILKRVQDDGLICYNNNGFTLIELLVVVLTIGILAAVAFPKYQTAVDKASISCVMPVLKTLTDAQQAAALARGDYPPEGTYFTFDDLDVDIKTTNENCKSTDQCTMMCAQKEFNIVLRNTATWANFWWAETDTMDRLQCVNKDKFYYLLQCSSDRCKRAAKAFGGKFAYRNDTIEFYVL